jgi:hypothetical protein
VSRVAFIPYGTLDPTARQLAGKQVTAVANGVLTGASICPSRIESDANSSVALLVGMEPITKHRSGDMHEIAAAQPPPVASTVMTGLSRPLAAAVPPAATDTAPTTASNPARTILRETRRLCIEEISISGARPRSIAPAQPTTR